MAEIKQNLPFRPLEVRGHGVWDPERKAFYPFKTSAATVPAKKGIRYFVHAYTTTLSVSGITASLYAQWSIKINGATNPFGNVTSPALTQETDYWSSVNAGIVDILSDPYSAITEYGDGTVVYAEIPDDISGQ